MSPVRNARGNGHVPGELFRGYLDPARPHAGAYDEMFASDASVRAAYRTLHDVLAPSDVADLGARSDALGRAFVDQGITFALSGQERPFPLDLVPRVITASEWSQAGARHRAAGAGARGVPGRRLRRRADRSPTACVPRRLITSSSTSTAQAVGIQPPNGVRVHVAGIDLVRDDSRHVPGAGGQRAHALGRLLRDGEPRT